MRKRYSNTTKFMKSRNEKRGGQTNEQRELLDEYEAEKAEALKNDPNLTEDQFDQYWLEWLDDQYSDDDGEY